MTAGEEKVKPQEFVPITEEEATDVAGGKAPPPPEAKIEAKGPRARVAFCDLEDDLNQRVT